LSGGIIVKIKVVLLIVIISFLCISAVSVSAVETSDPVASFSADVVNGKTPLQVIFTDTSTGDPTAWLWDFGDGSTAQAQDPVHSYTVAGDYNVSLTVTNANGSDSLTRTNYIHAVANAIPIVKIDYIRPNPAIKGETVDLIGLITYNDSAIITHEWRSDLVERRLCTGRTLYISVLPVGNHTISFRAMDKDGDWSEKAIDYLEVRENSIPTAAIVSIDPEAAFEGEAIAFSGSGSDTDGNITAYRWRSGIDNELSTDAAFSTSSLSAGTHVIYFSVKDNRDKWSSEASRTVTVKSRMQSLQAGFVNAISVSNPVDITINLTDTYPVTAEFSVTDVNGVAVLTENITEKLASGKYTFTWDPADQSGEPLPSGIYSLDLLITSASGHPVSEHVKVTVDNTAPSVVINDISGTATHGKVVYASSGLLVKVSESGTQGDAATVSLVLLSGSDIVKTVSANLEDGFWLGEFDLSSISKDGNYTIRAVAQDAAKNVNSATSDIVINIDRTAPVLEAVTPSKDHIFAEDTAAVDIRFNYSDARTGINTSTIVFTFDNVEVADSANATITGSYVAYNATGLAAGAHSASVYVEDTAGNAEIFSTGFRIGPQSSKTTSSGSRSSGGGGGGGGTTGEKYENIQVKEVQSIFVNAGSHIKYEFKEDGNAITSIRFDALKNSGKVQAVIEVLKGSSSFAKADAPGVVYQQMNIWVGSTGFITPENVDIGNLLIGFKVEKSWLEENKIDNASVKLYRYADGSWSALPANVTGDDAEYVYFESRTSGFSPFAIVSETRATEEADVSLRSAADTVADGIADEGPMEETVMTGITSAGIIMMLGVVSMVLATVYVLHRKRS